METVNLLRDLLSDPSGEVVIFGSREDRRLIKECLDRLEQYFNVQESILNDLSIED